MPDSIEALDQKVVSSQTKLFRAIAAHEKAKSATEQARQAYSVAATKYERRERDVAKAAKDLMALKGASGPDVKPATAYPVSSARLPQNAIGCA